VKNKTVIYKNIGTIDYKEAWELQEDLFADILKTKEDNTKTGNQHPTTNYLLFCEHPHVYTLGKSGNENNLLINNDLLRSKGASLFKINRGGDITYHGPGQLVGYPLLDLDNFNVSIKDYIYGLEEAIINTLKHYNIIGTRMDGATGVWLDAGIKNKERKICAFGIRASRLVTMHGFALNINTDLNFFKHIIPCGLTGKGVTSMQNELGKPIDVSQIKRVIIDELQNIFRMKFV